MTEPNTLLSAKFNELVKPYLVLYVALVLAITVVGIPLAALWLVGVGPWWARHYYKKLMCQIDDKEIRFRKGIIFQVEKTIPLENIQDVTFIEGPLLRKFHLAVLKFETAGQTAGQAHDMSLIGIIDAHEFRDEILRRRSLMRQRSHPLDPLTANHLTERNQMQAVLQKLDRVIELLERNQS